MQEFGSNYEAETLRSSKRTDLADVIVYIYDSSDTNSFSYISNLRVRIFLNFNTVPAYHTSFVQIGQLYLRGLEVGMCLSHCVFRDVHSNNTALIISQRSSLPPSRI